MSAGDVVGCVADDDELFGREIELQVFADALSGERRKIAAVVRLVSEGAGQREEFRKANQLHLQIGGGFDVTGHQGRSVARMLGQRCESLTNSREDLGKLLAFSNELAQCCTV